MNIMMVGWSKRIVLISATSIFANQDTKEAIQSSLRRLNWKILKPETFEFKSLKIHPFSVPHDAYDPVGFYFQWGNGDLLTHQEA